MVPIRRGDYIITWFAGDHGHGTCMCRPMVVGCWGGLIWDVPGVFLGSVLGLCRANGL